MKLLIFSGTTEGRELSRRMADAGAAVTVCVATNYGQEEQGSYPGVTVLTGRKSQEEIAGLAPAFDLCVDATHPYAVEVTQNIRAACASAGVPYRRLLRQSTPISGAVLAESPEEAARWLAEREGNILLTTGAKELPAFAGLDVRRLFPRVLPNHNSLTACESLGIPHRNILAMQGPFSAELNEALIRQFHIRFLVTKDGGRVGGFMEKAQAAKRTGVTLVVIRRPEDSGQSFRDILTICKEMMT